MAATHRDEIKGQGKREKGKGKRRIPDPGQRIPERDSYYEPELYDAADRNAADGLLRAATSQSDGGHRDDPSRLSAPCAALSPGQSANGKRGPISTDQRSLQRAQQPGRTRTLRYRPRRAETRPVEAGLDRQPRGERFRHGAVGAPDGSRGALYEAQDGARPAGHLRVRPGGDDRPAA